MVALRMQMLAAFILFLTGYVKSCGITTHLDIAARASSFFDFTVGDTNYGSLLRSHDDAFQGSTSYPDAFYNGLCQGGQFHSLAEDTHWTPFMEVAVSYIRETYPKPWTRDGEKLVVFLLGIVSHQVSDATWHSLGIDQGFITAMAGVNFHGSFGDAHSHGDFGGDVVSQYELEFDWIGTLLKWYVPTEDLVNIYERYYGEKVLTEEEIVACHNWMYLGRWGEQLGVIELLTPLYISKSPFLGDRLQDYFLAGVDDMATWVGNVWNHTATMLEYGTEVCDLPENPIYITCNARSQRTRRESQQVQEVLPRTGMHHSEALSNMAAPFGLRDVIVEKEGKGYSIRPSDRLMELYYKNRAELMDSQTLDTNVSMVNNHTIVSDQLYSRFGQTVAYADLNMDGWDDLIIGAPGFSSAGNYQQGRVYIHYGNPDRNTDLDNNADVIIDGPELNGRFGWALTALDFNADGLLDLAVGAPSTGSPSLTYNGAVYIYYGSSVGNIQSEPGTVINCQETFCNLGWSLSANDLNGDDVTDLVVGAPFAPSGGKQRGLVGVLFSRHKEIFDYDETDFDWIHVGEHDYSWSGFDVSSAGQWLAVGSPQHRICARADCSFSNEDIQAVGKVEVYGTPLSSSPQMEWQGQEELCQLGSTLKFNSAGTLLAVAAPTQSNNSSNQEGVVHIYDLTNDGEEKIALKGETRLSRFGSSIEFIDLNGDGTEDVAIGAPFWSTSISTAQSGQILGFYSNRGEDGLLEIQERQESDADVRIVSDEIKSRFGWSLAFSRNQRTLAVSSPFSAEKANLGGKITVFEI